MQAFPASKLIYSKEKEMMKLLAIWLANRIVKGAGDGRPVEVIAYGLEIILNITMQLALLALLGYIFGILPTVMAAVLPTVVYRTLSGGSHFSTFWSCTLVSMIIFTVLGYIVVSFKGDSGIIITAYLLMVLVAWKWSPYNPNRFFEKHKIRALKMVSICYLMIFLILSLTVSVNDSLKGAVMLGLAWQTLNITPIGATLIGAANQLINGRKEGVKNVQQN